MLKVGGGGKARGSNKVFQTSTHADTRHVCLTCRGIVRNEIGFKLRAKATSTTTARTEATAAKRCAQGAKA